MEEPEQLATWNEALAALNVVMRRRRRRCTSAAGSGGVGGV
jgi:hypothetical protein